MRSKSKIKDYLFQNIPISKALGIDVIELQQNHVTLSAPLENNINHKQTVFGGSLQSVATLACWTLAHINSLNFPKHEIVIISSTIDYLLPVKGDFIAKCVLNDDAWARTLRALDRKQKAKIYLGAEIIYEENVAVNYSGEFAVLMTGD